MRWRLISQSRRMRWWSHWWTAWGALGRTCHARVRLGVGGDRSRLARVHDPDAAVVANPVWHVHWVHPQRQFLGEILSDLLGSRFSFLQILGPILGQIERLYVRRYQRSKDQRVNAVVVHSDGSVGTPAVRIFGVPVILVSFGHKTADYALETLQKMTGHFTSDQACEKARRAVHFFLHPRWFLHMNWRSQCLSPKCPSTRSQQLFWLWHNNRSVSVMKNSPPLYFFALNLKGPLVWEGSPIQN